MFAHRFQAPTRLLGLAKPSGVSFDPGSRRLFATDTGNVAQVGVHIFPVL